MTWFLIILGSLITAFLLLVLYAWLDPHTHRCRCGMTWHHFGRWNGAGERFPRSVRAHTCERCGNVQWWRSDGT